MGVGSYLGFVGLSFVVAVGVVRFEPATVRQMGRDLGLDRTKGWALFTVAVLWTFLPVLAGAGSDDGDLWMIGSAFALVGFYLLAMAVGSVDEYRLLRAARVVEPRVVTEGLSGEVVATSGTPFVDEDADAATPFTGVPAVQTDWIVQRRDSVGLRRTWTTLATGVQGVRFTLGNGRVVVEPGRHRVFSDARRVVTVAPDDPLPDRSASFLRTRADLPDPDERRDRLRFVEQFVPAVEPVTVVGVPRRGEVSGQVVVDEAPPDDFLGTHADHATGEGDEPEAVLLRGDGAAARERLHRRVYWIGAAGVVAVVGGQLVAFAHSAAMLGPLF